MTRTAATQRTALRVVHLTVGALLATYVYLPADAATWLRWPLMVVGVPAVTVSGLWIWKQAAVRRWLAGRRHQGAGPVRRPVGTRG